MHHRFGAGGLVVSVAPWLFLAIMSIKFATQVFFRADGISGICSRGKKLALTLGAGGHSRDLALMPQDYEFALGHDAISLAHFPMLRQLLVLNLNGEGQPEPRACEAR